MFLLTIQLNWVWHKGNSKEASSVRMETTTNKLTSEKACNQALS